MGLVSPNPRAERWLAVYLALIAGYVDAYTIRAYRVYVSFMSGNTTQTGSMIGQSKLLVAVPTALAILCFLAGSVVGTWFSRSQLRNPRGVLFCAIAAALATTILSTLPNKAGVPPNACISILALAMGLLNATHSHVGAEPMSLTFVTGTLHKVGMHLALAIRRAPLPDAQGAWDTHLHRAGAGASVWSGFLLGAIFSAAAGAYFGVVALLPPAIALLVLAPVRASDRAASTHAESPIRA
jgi:uncharacterized membrane protein YoaK (UPF0700 family)